VPRQSKKEPILRVSYLVNRTDVPRLDWMMKTARLPTKVDLIRAALNHFEDYLVEKEAKQAEQRKLAGAPD